MKAVRKMFSRSRQHKLMYLVGDGDSKAFLDVWDVYGICQHCEKVKSILIKRGGPEYDAWKNSLVDLDIYDKSIIATNIEIA